MSSSLARRILAPIVQAREGEAATALLMFSYSFLAMTAYNIVKPITRSKFISGLGADNLPYVQLAAGLLIGALMQGYGSLVGRLPRRWVIPLTQAGMAAVLAAFWVLFGTKGDWVSVAFYMLGLILGILLISQFWTLANDIFDARQAKRLFGFIGGGASLGGMTGAGLTALVVKRVGTENLLLCSAGLLAVCAVLVSAIVRREAVALRAWAPGAAEKEGLGGKEAFRLLRESRHLQIIALVIGFAAIGAAIIEQQLNMAAEAFKGRSATDAITGFLAQVTLYLSAIGFLIQVGLTSRIHRLLGIGFALMVLPASLGLTGLVMLFNAALWAPALARILDTSLRYTVDKTTREILFLPLSPEVKYKAKPFVDVTVDRFAKGLGALLVLILIKPWGLGLDWQRLSYASLAVMAVWVFTAILARREYLAVFRRSIERQELQPAEVRVSVADLTTIEALVEELAHPDEQRVLYAIDLLESLEKRNLITPLLLHHESAKVRARALAALGSVRPEIAERWLPAIERMLKDASAEVRAAAVRALAAVRKEQAAEAMRPYLEDPDPPVAVTAAVALAGSSRAEDVQAAEATLQRLSVDPREAAAHARQQVATALAEIEDPRFRHLLVPLMYDSNLEVAREAIRSAGRLGASDFLFVPPLVSLLRHRRLKPLAREVLVGYGEGVLDALGHFLGDAEEDVWVRRHIPATLALIPCQRSMDLLMAVLGDPDGFLRYKALAAIEKMRREHPGLSFDRGVLEELAVREARHHLRVLSLQYNLVRDDGVGRDSLLVRALDEKLRRGMDRVYRILGLLYAWKDVVAARWSIEKGDARARASAAEYLDNLLGGPLRRWLMPVLEQMPQEEKVRRGNALLRTRIRDTEDTLSQLVHDEDEVVAATAIHLVEQKRLWALADDLEHALSHRDARDWQVFEAASWALAAHRLSSAERRSRWMEPLPAVEAADRLRRIPLFAFVSVDELMRIAGMGRPVRQEAGRVLYQRGEAAVEVQFLMDGRVVREDGAGTGREQDAPAPLAFEEVLEGSPLRDTVRTTEGAICLALSTEKFLTLLSDNIELSQGLFRMLLEARSADWRRVLPPRSAGSPRSAKDGFPEIEKILLLKESPIFARASGEQLLQVARIARVVPLSAGSVLFGEGERPAIYMLQTGELSLESARAGGPVLAGPGDTLGIYETLGGAAAGGRAEVTRAGTALRIEREALFDLLADHLGLLQGIFSALLASSTSEPARAATVQAEFTNRDRERA